MTNRDEIDPEELAAFVDGRGEKESRDAMVARLAESESDRELFADVLAATREIAPVAIGSVSSHRSRWKRTWLPLAIAAGFALALLPIGHRTFTDGLRDPRESARSYVAGGGRMPDGWDPHPWGVTRGAAPALSEPVAAFRIGSRIADLEVALATTDTASAAVAATEISEILELLPAGGPSAEAFRTLPTTTPAFIPAQIDAATVAAQNRVDVDYLHYGAWIEAARLAARRDDRDFFATRESRRAARRAATLPSLPALARVSVDSISTAVESARTTNLRALERLLSTVSAAVGR